MPDVQNALDVVSSGSDLWLTLGAAATIAVFFLALWLWNRG
jgi:hypothetical protein